MQITICGRYLTYSLNVYHKPSLRTFIIWTLQKMASEAFQEGKNFACSLFNIKNFHVKQEKTIRAYFEGKDAYFSAPTGSGRSLIFHPITTIFADSIPHRIIIICHRRTFTLLHIHTNDKDLRDIWIGAVVDEARCITTWWVYISI